MPVVIQDPVWEQSFPAVGGVALPIVDVSTGRGDLLRLTQSEAEELRARHEQRLDALLRSFRALDIDAVLISSAEPEAVLQAFLDWATERLLVAGRSWARGA